MPADIKGLLLLIASNSEAIICHIRFIFKPRVAEEKKSEEKK
jgi:hypothetical protein